MQLPAADEVGEATPGKEAGTRRGRWGYTLTSWLGLVPFLLFCLLFEVLPAIVIIQGSFLNDSGAFTLANYQHVFAQISNLRAFQTSISISLITAIIGAVLGFLAAYGVYNLRTRWLRNFLVSFSSIAANFAGVPLAFAFVATLGVTGFVTVLLHNWLHVNLYDLGFSIYKFWGLVIVYVYFQLPLMILITVPALGALRPEWREAATNLGASSFTYWRRVALPVLLPSLIAGTMLLFANSFGAFATAFALAQGNINLVPILISFVVAGNVGMDVGLGNALAVGMIIVLLVAVSLYTSMLRRVSVWQGK
ncbi:ABC transporter permease subunit [Ktedonosporobacter rubrisoli]|uniref:ABC transporter permease subunit n=1 Tax=Ktedonosporobacter rubrisoli TaxID=2509675 RepID=A0A4P6K134_KTERU|nr:ABC transporter permease subunit [Ktedonosporobacter rubrisoli]QBD81774.1 ABC transporter permease subunit [Ktedonosporobacter rubrisoli]